MASEKQSKTEKATPRKIRKAREKGQLARSRDIPMTATLIVLLIILYFFGSNIVDRLEAELQYHFRILASQELTVIAVTTILRDVAFRIGTVLVPIFITIAVVSIAGNAAQGGLVLFPKEALKPKFNKLNPTQGIKKIFSKNGLINLAKSVIMMVAVGIISWQVINEYMTMYPRMVMMDVQQIFYWTAMISFKILIRVALLLIVLSIADYIFQRYQFLEQLKMSKQEYKETEGDPTTKRRIRRVQLETARKRMMADVPTADVVITNPTHFAVALSYKMESMEAPKVIAKGSNLVAQKIKDIALEHDIPIVENKSLAQTLYRTVKIGNYIPLDLYKAVAEILAYVFKARNMYQR
jgi:flagellar biosynthetic protein FlhB